MNNNKIIFIIAAVSIILLIAFPIHVEARAGCCSHHGGVCSYECPNGGTGYRCCDGSPLSAKCAPYYATCSSASPEKSGTKQGVGQPTQPKTEQDNKTEKK